MRHCGRHARFQKGGHYEDRIERTYPIQPELFDRLYEDSSSLERFQRTYAQVRAERLRGAIAVTDPRDDQLPGYHDPPVVEIVAAVQFVPLPRFGMPEIIALARSLATGRSSMRRRRSTRSSRRSRERAPRCPSGWGWVSRRSD